MNWGNRVLRYNRIIDSYKSKGYLTSADISNAGILKSDAGYNRLIQVAKNRVQTQINTQKRNALLARTGGLTDPGNNPTDAHYKRYLGITKAEANSIIQPVVVESKRGGDTYKYVTPDFKYYIQKRYSAEANRDVSRSLSGNKKFQLQSMAVDRLMTKLGSQIKANRNNPKQINNISKLQPRTKKVSKNVFSASSLLQKNKSLNKSNLVNKKNVKTNNTLKDVNKNIKISNYSRLRNNKNNSNNKIIRTKKFLNKKVTGNTISSVSLTKQKPGSISRFKRKVK